MDMYNNFIEFSKNGDNIIFNPQTGLLAHDVNALEQYERANDLHDWVEEPGMDREIQGFTFVLTTKCNLNCKYCYSITQNKPMSMAIDDPSKILARYLRDDAKVIMIHFFGGEPTLEMETIKHTVDYLKTVKDKTIYLRISTNGFVKKENLDYLIDHRFLISVSNDGIPAKDSSLAKRRGGTVVEDTIKYLAKKNALFNIRCTVTKDNVASLPEAIPYWKSIGVKHAHVEPYHPIGLEDESELLPDIATYVSSFKKMLEVAEQENSWVSSGVYMNLLTPSTYFCTGASGRFRVFSPDGSITTCYRVQSCGNKIDQFYIGNWKKNPTEKREIANFKHNRDTLPCHSIDSMETCKNCKYALLCGGGCLMRNLTQAGSFTKTDQWICTVKKLLLNDAMPRAWNAIEQHHLPVMFGRFVFEYELFNTPSLGDTNPMHMEDFKYHEKPNNVIDLYQILDINRNIEQTAYKKIARSECL